MSEQIDNKVVEMRFDNKDFERNVKVSLSTLDRLKQSLKFDKAAAGFNSISTASKKVDMSGLQNGVETLKANFSAMDVVAVTALSNITNSAIRAGKNIVSALTIDPVRTGYQEYETQIGAIQTILANTQKEGTNVKMVNAALDELNEYADKTIYNFTEMTRNIGTFTAAGVKLDTSVQAIKGIANLAAVSGSTSQQASVAMYQLSQALAAGKVQLMDWNSVVNAGMGGQVFQDALIRTSELLGTGAKKAIEASGSFRESLTKTGWLTTEVLTQTLDQFATAADTQEEYAAAVAKFVSQGYTEEQARQIADMAKTAGDAATKVKTLSQLWDVLKESAQSGWATTWRLIVGDFEAAKGLFTPLSEFLSNIIQRISEARNALLESALGKTFTGIVDNITKIAKPVEKLSDSFETVKESIVDLGDIVNDVLVGKFGNGEERFNALTNAGINFYEVQNKVNEELGNSFRYTQAQIDAQNAVLGSQNAMVQVTQEAADATGGLSDKQKELLAQLMAMSDAQLKARGYTDDQIESLDQLRKLSQSLGLTYGELLDQIETMNGRSILLDSFKRIGSTILNIFSEIGEAFREVFKPMTGDDLFNIIAAFHKFSTEIELSEKSLNKIGRVFRGLFGVVKIFTTLISGGATIAWRAFSFVLSNFGVTVLDVAAAVGDALYYFSDFITFGETAEQVFQNLGSIFSKVADGISDFIYSLTGFSIKGALSNFGGINQLPGIKQLIDSIHWAYDQLASYAKQFAGLDFASGIKKVLDDAASAFKGFVSYVRNLTWDDVITALKNFNLRVIEIFKNLKEKFEEIGPDLIAGLQNGLKDGVEKVVEWMRDIGEKIIEAIKAVLGIHSPSTVMFEIGQNIVQGLINGIASLIGGVANMFRGLGDAIVEAIGPIDWGAVAVAVFGAGMFMTLYKFTDALQGFSVAAKNVTAPMAGVGKVFTSVSEAIDTFTGQIKGGTKLQAIANSIKTFAESIAILAASVGALALIDPAKLWNAVKVIGALAAIMGALTIALEKFATGGKPFETLNISGIILSLGGAFVMLGIAAKIMGSVDEQAFDNARRVLITFGTCIAALILVTSFAGNNLDKAAAFIGKIGTCFLLLGVAAKLVGSIDGNEYENAKRMLSGFAVVVGLLVASTHFAGPSIDKASGFVTKVGAAFLLLSITAKLMGGMKPNEMEAAKTMLSVFAAVVGALIAVAGLFGSQISKVSDFVIKIAGAFALLAIAAKIMGSMEPGEMVKAGVALVALGVIVGMLVAISNLAPRGEIAKISATLIAMSLAIGILAGISVLLSMVKTENLIKGIAAVSALSLLMAMMTFATRGASDVKGSMIGIAIAIGVMAAAIAVLSFIDTNKLIGATVALSAVMGMFALVESQMGKGSGALKSIVALTVAIGAIGVVLYMLASLPVESTIASAIALSSVLLALSVSIRILDKVGDISKSAIISIGVLGLVMAGVAGILYLLRDINAESAIASALSISTVLLTMSVVCKILSTIHSVSTTALVAMGALGLVVAEIALVLGVMSALDVQPSIESAVALSTMLLGMSAAMVILSSIGPMATGAIAAAGSLAAVIGILSAVVVAAGAIKQIPGVDWLVSEGGEFLQKIGEAIGKFIGGFVGGALDGLTSNLVNVADNLSNFVMHLMPFIAGVKMIDPSVQSSIDTLAGVVLSLTASSFVTGIADLLGISTDFGALGDKLVPFGKAIKKYSDAIQGIDAGSIAASGIAADTLARLASTLPKEGGLVQAIFGTTTGLDTFGEDLVDFGTGLKSYSDSVKDLNVDGIQASVSAAQALSSLASTLPKEGGLSQSIFGTTSGLDTFGDDLTNFGKGISAYGISVTDLNIAAIQSSVEAASALNDLAGKLGTEGGAISFFTGEGKSFNTFGEELKSFGESLKTYTESLSDVDFTKITSSMSSIKQMVTLASSLLNADLSGIPKFANIKNLAIALKSYYSYISEVDVSKVASSINSISAIIDSINSMGEINIANIVKFQSAIAMIGKTDLSSVISAFEKAGSKAFSAGLNFVKMLSSGITSGGALAVGAAKRVVSNLISVLDRSSQMFVTNGTALAKSVASGIEKGRGVTTNAVKSLVQNAANVLRGYYGSFSKAGQYLASGFAVGIRSGSFAASVAARAMANAAVNAARKALDEHSPSRVFRKIGSYVAEGFAIGITRSTGDAERSARDMASNVITASSKALSKLSDTLNIDGDMDLNPVISPVLDLDNIKNGASTMESMLATATPTFGVTSALRINRQMNSRIQNGANDDVVGAINDLRKGLKNLSGNTYTINGLTYDDGSAVASVVEDLIRATRMQRRV